MRLSLTRLVLLVSALNAAISLAAPTPFDDASSTMKIRDLEARDGEVRIFDVYSRNIEAREPTPIDFAAAAAINLEKRNPIGAIVQVGKMIAEVVMKIKQAFAADKEHRSGWTQELVSQMYAKDRSRNYIVCHTKHTYKFDGVRGKDWDHRHEELPVGIFKKTTGFEIYWLHGGTFKREGDGGFLNWAYIGNVVKKSSDGKELMFK